MSALEWAVRIFLVFTFIAMAAAWKKVLDVVNPRLLSALPKDKKALDYIKNSDKNKRDNYVYFCYRDTLDLLSKELTSKEKDLKESYDAAMVAGGCLIVLLVLASLE